MVFTSGHTPGLVDAIVTNPDGKAGALAGGYTFECDTKPPSLQGNGNICEGGSLSLSVPSFPGATYAWTGPNGFTTNTRYVYIPVATPANSGTYTVTVSVYGCTLPPASTTVVVNPSPSATISAPTSVVSRSTGNVASVPDGVPGAEYFWYVASGDATITSPPAQRSITFDAGAPGDAVFVVYVSLGACSKVGTATIAVTPTPLTLRIVTPCRLVDTRLPDGPGGGPALSAGTVRNFPLASRCGLPAGTVAIAVNTTVTAPTSAGALRVYAGGTPTPGTTNLLFRANQTRAGSSIVALGPDGSVDVVTTQVSGTAHVILDVGGYFK